MLSSFLSNESTADPLLIFDISKPGYRSHGGYSPKICPISIDEVASLGIARDVMTPAEHGGQHGVLESSQRGQPSGEVRAPDVQRDDLWKLQHANGRKKR